MLEEGKYYLYSDCHVVTFIGESRVNGHLEFDKMYYLSIDMSRVDYCTGWRIREDDLHRYVELNNDRVVTDNIRERIIRVAERKQGICDGI